MVDELFDRLRLLEQDHEPDGWPAVQMRDITALLNEADAARSQIADLCAANQALLAEVEALRQKAARYDWLRDNWGYVSETYDGDRATEVFLVDKADGWDTDPDSLDAAIDAALSTKEPG